MGTRSKKTGRLHVFFFFHKSIDGKSVYIVYINHICKSIYKVKIDDSWYVFKMWYN